MQLVDASVTFPAHEYSTITCARDGNHCDAVRRYYHVGGIKLDDFMLSVFPYRTRLRGQTKKNDGDWCTNNEQVGDFVNKYVRFRLHQSDVCNWIRLLSV